MENLSNEEERYWKKAEAAHSRGKVMGGLLLATIGALFLMKALGAVYPAWLLTWKMLLIGLAVVVAVKHKLRHPAWIVLLLVGGGFLAVDLFPTLELREYIWPALLIALGLFIVFKPRRPWNRHWSRRHWKHHQWHHGQYKDCYHHQGQNPGGDSTGSVESGDVIESVTVFASVKKNIITKNFKGGEVVNVFGGSEINLSQADFEGESASLEVTQVFGGTKLIVPQHWEIRSELVTFLGSVEDKRPVSPLIPEQKGKTLILTGTTVMGGIEIRSF